MREFVGRAYLDWLDINQRVPCFELVPVEVQCSLSLWDGTRWE